MHDAKAVARALIEMAAERQIEITNLKLQKLLYFAHGLMLAQHGRALVNENFQAWKYGPVLEDLYHDLKVFGTSPIRPEDGFIKYWPTLPENADAEKRAISDVLDQLGTMRGGELINLSHDPNGPWHAVFQEQTESSTIGDDRIESYFKTIVAQ